MELLFKKQSLQSKIYRKIQRDIVQVDKNIYLCSENEIKNKIQPRKNVKITLSRKNNAKALILHYCVKIKNLTKLQYIIIIMIGQIFNAKDYTTRLKATVQATGKLGFTAETISQLKLNTDCNILIAPDSDDKMTFYMSVQREENENGFPVLKSGSYFYLNTKQLFDALAINYTTATTIFDLSRFEEGDTIMQGECYKMTMRTISKKTNED